MARIILREELEAREALEEGDVPWKEIRMGKADKPKEKKSPILVATEPAFINASICP